MKLTLQIQHLPDKQQAHQLKSTMERFNQACSWPAEQAFELKTANKIALQQHFYYELRERFDLSAQMASICIRHVGGTYSRYIGVDFGVVNLATDNDCAIYTNTETEKARQKQNKVRPSLGRKAGKVKRAGARPKNTKRKLKALSGKERRFKA